MFWREGPQKSQLVCQEDESIFIDRNAEVFQILLDYLRNDLNSMPEGLDAYRLHQFKQELDFWEINQPIVSGK